MGGRGGADDLVHAGARADSRAASSPPRRRASCPGTDAATVRAAWEDAYADERFVQVLPDGQFPRTADVLGANTALMGLAVDEAPAAWSWSPPSTTS